MRRKWLPANATLAALESASCAPLDHHDRMARNRSRSLAVTRAEPWRWSFKYVIDSSSARTVANSRALIQLTGGF
jgi:hypothetical protein